MRIKDYLKAFEGKDENTKVFIVQNYDYAQQVEKIEDGYYFFEDGYNEEELDDYDTYGSDSYMGKEEFDEDREDLKNGDSEKVPIILIYTIS